MANCSAGLVLHSCALTRHQNCIGGRHLAPGGELFMPLKKQTFSTLSFVQKLAVVASVNGGFTVGQDSAKRFRKRRRLRVCSRASDTEVELHEEVELRRTSGQKFVDGGQKADTVSGQSTPLDLFDGGGVRSGTGVNNKLETRAQDEIDAEDANLKVILEKGHHTRSAPAFIALPPGVLDAIAKHNPGQAIEDPNDHLIRECWRMRKKQNNKDVSDVADMTIALTGVKTLRLYAGPSSDPPIELLFVTKGVVMPDDISAKRTFVISGAAMRKLAGLQVLSGGEMVGFVARQNVIKSLTNLRDDAVGLGVGFPEAKRILVLDAVEDPGNMGALLRSASAFGWDSVVLLPGCCNPLMKKASNASRGAHFQLPMAQASIQQLQAFARSRDMELLCACPAEVPVDDFEEEVTWEKKRLVFQEEVERIQKGKRSFCLILGNEKSGICEEVKSICTRQICVPMVGHMESLNVSVAGGILLYLFAGL